VKYAEGGCIKPPILAISESIDNLTKKMTSLPDFHDHSGNQTARSSMQKILPDLLVNETNYNIKSLNDSVDSSDTAWKVFQSPKRKKIVKAQFVPALNLLNINST